MFVCIQRVRAYKQGGSAASVSRDAARLSQRTLGRRKFSPSKFTQHPLGHEAAIRQIINEGKKRLDQKELIQVRADVWLPTHEISNFKFQMKN